LTNTLESSQKGGEAKKCKNINIKSQFESQKHLHKATFETLKYLKKLVLKLLIQVKM
jgi:hypothetical protein